MSIQYMPAVSSDWSSNFDYNQNHISCKNPSTTYLITINQSSFDCATIEVVSSLFTQTNMNDLILKGLQIVFEKLKVTDPPFTLNLEPPVFLNSAEEIRAVKGDDLFNRIKAIVDDQKMHRSEYFAPLRNSEEAL